MESSILIVDDEEQLRKLLTRIISLEGFKVVESGTLKNAADQLSRQLIDVILCDVRLPDGNGVDFVKTVRSNHPNSEIILLTAYGGNRKDSIGALRSQPGSNHEQCHQFGNDNGEGKEYHYSKEIRLREREDKS